MYKYTYFQPDLDGERFLADLRHNLSRPVVFDAIMRVRTSTGVRPVEFYGSFFMANTTDTELASINSDMAVACKKPSFYGFFCIELDFISLQVKSNMTTKLPKRMEFTSRQPFCSLLAQVNDGYV